MTVELATVRQMWKLLEPIHAVLYYAPEVFAQVEKLGFPIETRWPSYFPLRAAPLGPVGPEVVAATFYSFNPDMVREHAHWQIAQPHDLLAARATGVGEALARLTGDVTEAAELAKELAQNADTAGRPLGAANANLPWPTDPHLILWHAATILREVRGDGHVSALLTAGLDPTEALVSFAAVKAAPKEVFASRGWSAAQWDDAEARLKDRGWVNADGTATEAGEAGRQEVERITDELAATAYRRLGAEKVGRLAELLLPVTMTVVGSGLLPTQSTLGMGR
jgi:hypothetical protein